MKSSEIRKKFFDFFVKNGHEQIASSGLIPAQDPTLLFTNAGMNQFKDLFLGNEKRSYSRATTIQKCVRAGGKHNDLDNVGFTRRHLTFFEMMGNFSFNDYFKKEAIRFAWDLLTKEYKIDSKNMFVSVFKDDQESFDIWAKEIGVPENRIMRFDEKDNFWQMGDTGPCGPCTEIYIDLRPLEERSTAPSYDDFDKGRLLEIWNVVFMQYDRQISGEFKPLKHTGVDTGMGLERVTCILQNVDSVYKTDIFTPLIAEIEKLTGVNYAKSTPDTQAAFHVLCDHIRSTSLIIADGGSPSNEGRGYVLRKIIRRAALFAQKLTDKNIFPDLAKKFIAQMSPTYPELSVNQTMIVSILTTEIEQFAHNLIRGQQILQTYFKEQSKSKTITGEHAFKLYDTYGFPLEVTTLACQENGFAVDVAGFETCMEEQRKLSGKKMKSNTQTMELPDTMITKFVGYNETNSTSKIVGLVVDATLVKEVASGTDCTIITESTPFFAATGGQVDDQGTVTCDGKVTALLGLEKLNNGKAIGAHIIAPAKLKIGSSVELDVNKSARRMTMNNHTGTHLLQAALIELLGKQVKQSGSIVTPDYLRFDFTYHKNLTPEEITLVENRVNEKIMENIELRVFETTYKQALEAGVIAIFGEKYNPEKVRVVDVPGFSAELCGGTHVPDTGNIGSFKITEVSALSAGNRRIVAVTGPRSLELMQQNFNTVKAISQKFKVKPEEVLQTVEKQDLHLCEIQRQLKTAKKESMGGHVSEWLKNVDAINSVPFLFLLLENYAGDELKDVVTLLQQKQAGLFIAVSNAGDKSSFYLALSPQHEKAIDLPALTAWLEKTAGLRGGGKNGTLQGGGPVVDKTLGAQIKKKFAA